MTLDVERSQSVHNIAPRPIYFSDEKSAPAIGARCMKLLKKDSEVDVTNERVYKQIGRSPQSASSAPNTLRSTECM